MTLAVMGYHFQVMTQKLSKAVDAAADSRRRSVSETSGLKNAMTMNVSCPGNSPCHFKPPRLYT